MGEPKVVEQLDMGTAAVDGSKVVLPTTEHIIGFSVELTASDRKWCRFSIRTEHRTLSIEPGSIGQVAFDTLCEEVKAMFDAPAGATVLAKLRSFLVAKPLQVRVAVSEIAP